VSIESDANQDLALDDEDAEGVVGGHAAHKHEHKSKPAHQAAAETNVEVQASGGGFQPVVDDPSEDC
jgi:hypothetical protein